MEPPDKPDEADCCNSGCNPCILDVYEEQLRKYNESLLPEKKPNHTYVNCMKPTSYATFKLVKSAPHTPTTGLLTFEYVPPAEQLPECNGDTTPRNVVKVCYEPGQHFLVRSTSGSGDVFTRAYTPIPAPEHADLQFTILVRYYERGRMSRYLKRLKIGDVTRWRGPYGDYAISYTYRRILCIVQGTGIAPVYAVADRLVGDEECYTFVHVFCCYRGGGEMLLREELRQLAAHWNFTYEIFLGHCNQDDAEERFGEKINRGRLEARDVEAFVRDKGKEGLQVLICGGESFAGVVEGHVRGCGVQDVFVF